MAPSWLTRSMKSTASPSKVDLQDLQDASEVTPVAEESKVPTRVPSDLNTSEGVLARAKSIWAAEKVE